MNSEREIVELYLDDIIPNRFQPREMFEDTALKELAASIKEHGVIQPIIVRRIGDKYEIIAGERRYKATTLAGLTKIPAIVRNLDDKESSKVALLENLQRKDLNPIEEARTYQKILELDPITQDQLALTMGKSQSSIANKLRLLTLPIAIQEALLEEKISERHARSLLNISQKDEQIEILNKVINNKMTVRELDALIKSNNSQTKIEAIDNDDKIFKPLQNDLENIRKSYEDIFPPEKALADLDSLLKVPPKENNEETSYKFIPSFNEEKMDIADMEEKNKVKEESFVTEKMFTKEEKVNNVIPLKEDEIESLEEMFSNKANKNQERDIPINNNTLNNLEAIDVFDLKTAINSTRDLIKKIEKSGFAVDTEEINLEDKYKIIITIDKNQ